MSKSQLTKLLREMPREETAELLLKLYSARKEAKEFLDFFIDPDVGKISDKAQTAIKNEVWREVKHKAALRMTRIRKTVKWFDSFDPGIEEQLKLRLFAIDQICSRNKKTIFSDATARGVINLVTDTLRLADKNCMSAFVVDDIVRDVKSMPESYRLSFYHKMANQLRADLIEVLREEGVIIND